MDVHRTLTRLRMAVIAATACAMAASLLSGCSARSDLGQVSGKVTLNGKPLPDASLQFVPTSQGTTSFGKTDANGNYHMIFSRSHEGANLGESVVRISTRDVSGENGRPEIWKPELVPPRL